ncbi:hypothetical protein IAT38_005082 [Cryptococcus sp. DSM 104549]
MSAAGSTEPTILHAPVEIIEYVEDGQLKGANVHRQSVLTQDPTDPNRMPISHNLTTYVSVDRMGEDPASAPTWESAPLRDGDGQTQWTDGPAAAAQRASFRAHNHDPKEITGQATWDGNNSRGSVTYAVSHAPKRSTDATSDATGEPPMPETLVALAPANLAEGPMVRTVLTHDELKDTEMLKAARPGRGSYWEKSFEEVERTMSEVITRWDPRVAHFDW